MSAVRLIGFVALTVEALLITYPKRKATRAKRDHAVDAAYAAEKYDANKKRSQEKADQAQPVAWVRRVSNVCVVVIEAVQRLCSVIDISIRRGHIVPLQSTVRQQTFVRR